MIPSNIASKRSAKMSTIIETDIFIVGAGPAGGSLASFLAQNGISTLGTWKMTG
jgi:ribulose 1,5-bisphosphate synthetase/thiazole synthase